MARTKHQMEQQQQQQKEQKASSHTDMDLMQAITTLEQTKADISHLVQTREQLVSKTQAVDSQLTQKKRKQQELALFIIAEVGTGLDLDLGLNLPDKGEARGNGKTDRSEESTLPQSQVDAAKKLVNCVYLQQLHGNALNKARWLELEQCIKDAHWTVRQRSDGFCVIYPDPLFIPELHKVVPGLRELLTVVLVENKDSGDRLPESVPVVDELSFCPADYFDEGMHLCPDCFLSLLAATTTKGCHFDQSVLAKCENPLFVFERYLLLEDLEKGFPIVRSVSFQTLKRCVFQDKDSWSLHLQQHFPEATVADIHKEFDYSHWDIKTMITTWSCSRNGPVDWFGKGNQYYKNHYKLLYSLLAHQIQGMDVTAPPFPDTLYRPSFAGRAKRPRLE